MRVEIVGERSEKLLQEWESLLEGSCRPTPYLTPTWNKIWQNHFGQALHPRYLLFRDGGEGLLGLGALTDSVAEDGRKGLSLLGSSDVCDYRDLVVARGREEEVFQALAAFLRQGEWQTLDFRSISELSPTAQKMPPVMRSLGLQVTCEEEEPAVTLSLPPSWEDFLGVLNAKDRHELRRKMRRLEREPHAIEEVTDSLRLSSRMDAFLELHRKSSGAKAAFMTPPMVAYFQELAARFAEKGWLDMIFLKIGGRDVAAYFSFRYDGTEYVYNSGYDPEYSWFSPGIVLAAQAIRRAIARGTSRFNFLKGTEDYKYSLGGREEKILRIRVDKG